jgi:hypothetical protein
MSVVFDFVPGRIYSVAASHKGLLSFQVPNFYAFEVNSFDILILEYSSYKTLIFFF